MKRRPPPILDLPETPRRKRSLSEEEHALWESVAKQIRPLRKKPRVAKAEITSPEKEVPAATRHVAAARPSAPVKGAPPPKPQAPPLTPFGRRERSQLSRGRKEIDAR